MLLKIINIKLFLFHIFLLNLNVIFMSLFLTQIVTQQPMFQEEYYKTNCTDETCHKEHLFVLKALCIWSY